MYVCVAFCVVCCSLCVVRCALFVVRCLLLVVCYSLFVTRCVLLFVGGLLLLACCLLSVVCRLSFDVCLCVESALTNTPAIIVNTIAITKANNVRRCLGSRSPNREDDRANGNVDGLEVMFVKSSTRSPSHNDGMHI